MAAGIDFDGAARGHRRVAAWPTPETATRLVRDRAAGIPVPARLHACATTVYRGLGARRRAGRRAGHGARRARQPARVSQQPGSGTRFQLELPLSLSVVRSLLVEVAGEAYAFPLGHVMRAVRACARDEIEQVERPAALPP